MKEPTIGLIHSLETFGSVDGPGIRFVTFTQGCLMRCQFCHNPDTWKMGGGLEYTPQQLFDEAIRYEEFWGENGGVTVSGGEPLLQIDFLIEYFKLCKQNGVHTALDTSGKPFTFKESWLKQFDELLQYTDLFLFDLKHIDSQKHKALTSWPNENILDMAKYLSDHDVPVWIRHVLIPERTDFDEDLKALGAFIKTLNNVQKVEVLPYHKMGVYKWNELGLSYKLEGIEPPTEARVKNAHELLNVADYQGYRKARKAAL